jgi:SH3-like domain-containing protein
MLPGDTVAESPEDDTSSGEPGLNITSARMVNASTISIIADANLPNGTEVSAELLEDGESFEWFDGDEASAEVEGGEVELRLAKASEAPAADEDSTYTVLLTAEAGGQTLEATSELTVPGPFETAFYAQPTSVPPTATPIPEPEDAEPTPEPQPEPQPTPTTPPPPPPSDPQGLAVTVGNGGNVRAQPTVNSEIVGGIVLGDNVSVLEKTADDIWFRVDNGQGLTGWAHQAVLLLSPEQVAQIPVQGQGAAGGSTNPPPTGTGAGVTVTVGNGGNVRAQPTVNSGVVGSVVLGDTVSVLEKTADDIWFRIDTGQGVSGWAHQIVLQINPAQTAQVPVQGQEVAESAPADEPAPAPEPPVTNEPDPAPESPVTDEGGDDESMVMGLPSTTEGTLVAGTAQEGELNDLFAAHDWNFEGTAGQRVTIRVEAAPGEETDPRATLVGPDGSVLTSDDDGGGGLNAEISNYDLPADGTYTIKVDVFNGGGYLITLTEGSNDAGSTSDPATELLGVDESEGNGSPVLPPLALDARVQVSAI